MPLWGAEENVSGTRLWGRVPATQKGGGKDQFIKEFIQRVSLCPPRRSGLPRVLFCSEFHIHELNCQPLRYGCSPFVSVSAVVLHVCFSPVAGAGLLGFPPLASLMLIIYGMRLEAGQTFSCSKHGWVKSISTPQPQATSKPPQWLSDLVCSGRNQSCTFAHTDYSQQ